MNPGNVMTAAFLAEAGIGPGMRVLDIGCGAGDLSRAVARLVGQDGAVLAIDRDEGAIGQARAVPLDAGMARIDYSVVDLAGPMDMHEPFDAIVTRRVLMYLPDPAATLAALFDYLKPGGIVAVQEHAATGMPLSAVPMPLHEQMHDWMWTTVAREGGNVRMGLELPTLLRDAGLIVERVRAEGVIFPPEAPSGLAPIMQAMAPRIVRHGVASEAEIDPATLEDRLATERRGADATLLWDMAYLVSARKPG